MGLDPSLSAVLESCSDHLNWVSHPTATALKFTKFYHCVTQSTILLIFMTDLLFLF